MTARDSAAWNLERTDVESPSSASPATDVRRLAACARACDGIPTEELERGILHDLIAACIHLRDDDRVTEVLNRLVVTPCPSPRIVRRVEQLAAAGRDASPEPGQEPAASPGLTGMRAPIPAPVPVPLEASGERPVTAVEKFRCGMRVRISARGRVEMAPTSAASVGVVTGFSRSEREVRIVRDGRTTPERFSIDHWEPDPDFRDANESIVSGVRKPAGRDGEPLPVKRSPSLAWRRPPVSREALHARRVVEAPGSPRYDPRDATS